MFASITYVRRWGRTYRVLFALLGMFASPLSICPIWRGLEGMLCRGISLPVRRLSCGCSRCLLLLLAGAGGARGGEVGEWGIGLAVCILWSKGAGGIRRGECMLSWGMLSVTAPCWSWWGKRR